MSAQVIGFVNRKGGSGKTTACVNIGDGLARQGLKVLLIDMDSQGGLTVSLGLHRQTGQGTIYDVLTGGKRARDVIIHRGDQNRVLDVITSHKNLSAFELGKDPETDLNPVIKQLRGKYDYIIVDSPPSLSALTVMVLSAVDSVLIPLQPEFLAINALADMRDTIDRIIKTGRNRHLEISGILLTFYDSRRNLSKQIENSIRKAFPEQTLKQTIRYTVTIAEAPGFQKTIFEYAPGSKGALDYQAVIEELLIRQ